MPIYEYRCQSCGVELEKIQKISDPVLTQCPECGKPELIKLVSASSFRLKGSGWYETDFKTGKKKNVAGDSDSASTVGSTKSKNETGDSGTKASSASSGTSESSTKKAAAKTDSKSGS